MFNFVTKYWWVLVVRGVLAIGLGVLAFALPRETVAGLVLAFGLVALCDGTIAIVSAITGRKLPYWWLALIQGLLGVSVGALTLIQPIVTALALLIYIAVWAMGQGLLQIIAAVKLPREIAGKWWLAVAGALGIAFGVLLLINPAKGALAIVGIIGFFALLWGITLLCAGFGMLRLRSTQKQRQFAA